MNVIVIGCGRVGAMLAGGLGVDAHDVCVIDRNPKALKLLPRNYRGQVRVGNGYNRTVLEAAGIQRADALAAVTSGDNTNIVCARTARDVYRVPIVVARIYDPRRAEIYRGLGIQTVASVQWTVHRIQQTLLHRHLAPQRQFGSDDTLLVREPVPPYLAGRSLAEFEVEGEIRPVEVTRLGRSFIAAPGTPVMAGDVVTFAVAAAALDRLRAFLHKELGT